MSCAALLGGSFGVLIRFALIQYREICLLYTPLQLPTLLVNIIGAFIAGLLFPKLSCTGTMYSFFIIGLCGGMTTMSTCALESYLFIKQGDYLFGLTNATINLTLSILLVALGTTLSTKYL